jgi:hypothetical protein
MNLKLSNFIKIFVGSLLIISHLEAKGPIVSEKIINGLEFTLQIEKAVYQLKEPIPIQLILTNKTDHPLKLIFPSTQRYELLIKKEGKEIWQWSRDRVFAMMLTQLTIEPDESLGFEEEWSQLDNEGKLVLPGKYEIIGILKVYPQDIQQSLTIDVR